MTTFSRRKALALAGAVALASGLAAATPALAQDCEKVELTFTFWGSVNEKNDIENAVKNWNTNNPCIQVKPMHIPATGTNYVQKLTTMIASNTAPDTTRTSLPCGPGFWKCMPRRTPLAEREWLSWMKRAGIPAPAKAPSFQLSMKNPRSSPNTFGSMISASASGVGITSTYSSGRAA